MPSIPPMLPPIPPLIIPLQLQDGIELGWPDGRSEIEGWSDGWLVGSNDSVGRKEEDGEDELEGVEDNDGSIDVVGQNDVDGLDEGRLEGSCEAEGAKLG